MSKEINIEKSGVSRQANPTPLLNGQPAVPYFDDLGRMLMVPHQIRDLVATAQATISNGTSTALLAGVTDTFHDLIQVAFTNSSTVAAQVSLKDDGTGINFSVPAGGLVIPFQVPVKQNATGGQWNVDMEDITGTTIYVEALFIKNV